MKTPRIEVNLIMKLSRGIEPGIHWKLSVLPTPLPQLLIVTFNQGGERNNDNTLACII